MRSAASAKCQPELRSAFELLISQGKKIRKDCQGNNINISRFQMGTYIMIPQLSEALRFLFHVKPDPPGFRPSSTQEDAMDFNLNCRRRLNCGAPWAFWWFQHVSAWCSSKHVLCMSFPETKVNQALQVFRNIDPPIEGQEVGISEFGNGDICGN